jgi:hypothetical protein
MMEGHHPTCSLGTKAIPNFKQKPISKNKNGGGEGGVSDLILQKQCTIRFP